MAWRRRVKDRSGVHSENDTRAVDRTDRSLVSALQDGRRDGEGVGSPSAASPHHHVFVFEPLEPRLLLSADLSLDAGHAIISGLQHLDALIQNLNLTPDGGATVPIVNRSLADLAALGDPIAKLQSATSAYLANTGATIGGLAAALNQIPDAHGSATATVNGAVDTVSIQLTGKIDPAALVFDLSGSVKGLTLSVDQGHTAELTGDRTVALTFGVDTSSDGFLVTSGDFSANLHVASTILQTGLDFGGVATTVTNGSAAVDASLDARLVNPNQPGGPTSISDQQLISTPVTQLLHTSLTGQGSLGLDLTGTSLPSPEHVDIAWQAPFDPSSASVTYQANSTLEQLVGEQTPAPPQFVSLLSNITSDPPLYQEVGTALSDLKTILNNVQSIINTATVLAQNLPFVGSNLGGENILAPAIAQITALQNKLTSDLQSNTTVMSTVQSDIASLLSTAGILPDSGTTDVQLYYLTSTDSVTHHFAGEAVNIGSLTALEVDLVLGNTWHSQNPIGFDFGLPGLGLSVSNSTINGQIGWRFDVGFGMTIAGTAYLVLNSDPNNGGATLGLNLAYTLSQNFTAVGRMGFLEALVKEKPTDATHPDTGIGGSIGVALGTSTNQGNALSGGTELALGDLASITASPTFSLTAHSNLELAFGGDFEKDQSGNYTDKSQFPSIDADLNLDWSIGGSSPTSGAAPSVGFSNLQLDIGQAITDFILPVIKPFYDDTHGLEPIIDFLTSQVPVVGDTIKWAHDNLGSAADLALQQVLKTYDPSQPYDWLHFGVDLLIADGAVDETAGKDFVKGSEAVFQIIKELDTVYSDANTAAQGNPSLKINLGNFDFGGKDLRLAPFKPTNASDLANYTGNAIVDFSNLDQNDPQVQAAINSYMGAINNLLPGGVRNALNGVVSTISDVYNTLFAAGDLANSLPGFGSIGGPEQTLTKVTTPFFDDPASIIGILFGQNIDFIDIQLGYSYHYHKVQEFPVLSLFHIIDINLIFDTTLNFDVGLSFGYDTKGLVELLGHQANASLLDGIFIGGDPLLPGSNEVMKLDASIFVGAGADVLAGLAGAGIEGGLGLDASASLLTNPGETELHYNEFQSDTDFNLNEGLIGPIKLKADGWAQLRLMTEEFWGVARQYHDLTPKETIFNYPNNPNRNDIYPLGFYHPDTGELDLYVGPTANQRFVNSNGNYQGPPIDETPQSADDQLALSSDVYDITIDSGDKVTLNAYKEQRRLFRVR